MGFYGNLVYNTYGIQNASIKPQHLDRRYWALKEKSGIVGESGLRSFLGLEIKSNETSASWEERLNTASTYIFKFHFAPETNSKVPNNKKAEQTALRKLYGSGMLIGWVRRTTSGDNLYFMSLGDRTGQFFTYPLHKSSYNNVAALKLQADACASDQATAYMLKNHITTSQLKDSSVVEKKLANNSVSTDKIINENVVEEKIRSKAITPEKLYREHLEKIYVWEDLKTWDEFCTKVHFIKTKNSKSTQGGSIYFIKSILAELPSVYNNLKEKEIGRCIAWSTNEQKTFFIIECLNGRMWQVTKNTTSVGDKVVTQNNIKYKIELKQIITEQIADKAVTTNKIADYNITATKMAKDSVLTDAIKNQNVIPEKLLRECLEKTHIQSIGSWKILFSTVKLISTKNTKDSSGGSIYFIKEMNPALPDKFKNIYTENDMPFQNCIAWSDYNDDGLICIFIIDGHYGRQWKIIKGASGLPANQIKKESNVNYGVVLQTINSYQIANNAITKDKLSSEVLNSLSLSFSMSDITGTSSQGHAVEIPIGVHVSFGEGGCLYLGRVDPLTETCGFDRDLGYGIHKLLLLKEMQIIYVRPTTTGSSYTGGPAPLSYEIKYASCLAGVNMGKPDIATVGQMYFDKNKGTLSICSNIDGAGASWVTIGAGGSST